jgi:hypothetical protein
MEDPAQLVGTTFRSPIHEHFALALRQECCEFPESRIILNVKRLLGNDFVSGSALSCAAPSGPVGEVACPTCSYPGL